MVVLATWNVARRRVWEIYIGKATVAIASPPKAHHSPALRSSEEQPVIFPHGERHLPGFA